MKLKQRTRLEQLQATPKGGLKKVRGGAEKAADHKVRGQAHKVAGQVEPYTETARKVVSHRASEAWDWAEPRLEQAAETVQHDIAPRVSSALTTAAERSAPAREEALERGTAAYAALKGQPAAVQQKRRWPLAMLFFLVGGALGAAGAIFGPRLAPGQTVSAGASADGDRRNAPGREDDSSRNAQPSQT